MIPVKVVAFDPIEPVGVVIHHSGKDHHTFGGIRMYHILKKGWGEVGYHYIIGRDGSVRQYRKLNEMGAHALTGFGARNRTHIGICWIGDKSPTMEQYDQKIQALKEVQEVKYEGIRRDLDRQEEKIKVLFRKDWEAAEKTWTRSS
jgi:predicted esterase